MSEEPTKSQVLVTGGAGFIGSHLVEALVARGHRVRVLDDLSTGTAENLSEVADRIEFVLGDLRDPETLTGAVAGTENVYHMAAVPSVGRSVADPLRSHDVNATGTLGLLMAARDAGVRRVVYASSSSVYGDTPVLPKHEDMAVTTLSPYAASKLAGEGYCRGFTHSFGLETVSLRLFNVFGPRQDPTSEYAAVIPRFATRMLAGQRPVIFGDGRQSRDFTFIDNAVDAFLSAATADPDAAGEAMNVACGDRITLLDLVSMLNEILDTDLQPEFAEPRPGDVRHSQASIEKAERLIGYRVRIGVREGVARTVEWLAERDRAGRGAR